MTVGELLKELEGLPPQLEVLMWGHDDGHGATVDAISIDRQEGPIGRFSERRKPAVVLTGTLLSG